MKQPTSEAATPSSILGQMVRKRVESLSYLPTTAAVAMKFVQLGKDPEAEPSEYAKVISSDSSLCTKLLALANSSWFGVRNKVTKPQVAVNLLGLGTVRTLAISYCLTGLHNELRLGADESRMFWKASLCKAVAAREYAAHLNATVSEEAFAAALFEDFALAVMYACAKDAMRGLLEDGELDWKQRLVRERDLFELDHAEVGRSIAQKLELPDVFVDAVAFHHNLASLQEFVENRVLAEAVYVAALFPHNLSLWNTHDAAELRNFIAERTASKPLDFGQYLDTVEKQFNELYAYFENGEVEKVRLTELLEIATREAADNTTRLMGTVHQLLQETASAGKELAQVLTQKEELKKIAEHDPLTGVLNREGFGRMAADALTKAARYGSALAVMYLDVDQFKSLNDTMGHAMGDAALKRVAEVITGCIRSGDLVGRLGGDEFAAILMDCEANTGQQTARRIVEQMASELVQHGDRQAQVTLSCGLLTIPARSPVQNLETLLSVADKLMYQAKHSGGGCVASAGVPASAAA